MVETKPSTSSAKESSSRLHLGPRCIVVDVVILLADKTCFRLHAISNIMIKAPTIEADHFFIPRIKDLFHFNFARLRKLYLGRARS